MKRVSTATEATSIECTHCVARGRGSGSGRQRGGSDGGGRVRWTASASVRSIGACIMIFSTTLHQTINEWMPVRLAASKSHHQQYLLRSITMKFIVERIVRGSMKVGHQGSTTSMMRVSLSLVSLSVSRLTANRAIMSSKPQKLE